MAGYTRILWMGETIHDSFVGTGREYEDGYGLVCCSHDIPGLSLLEGVLWLYHV